MPLPALTPIQRRRLLLSAKWLVILLVVWGVARSVRGFRAAWAEHPTLVWRGDRWIWLGAAGLFYFLGMLPMGWYWCRLLRQMGQAVAWQRALAAYYAGHLGKYVPGKALVVVIRTTLLRDQARSATIVALSVFIETFTMMTVGATLATVLIAWQFAGERFLLGLAAGLTLLASVPTWPPLVGWLARRLRRGQWTGEMEQALRGYTWRVMASGWAAELLGWAVLGCSLWAVLIGMPGERAVGSLAQAWPRTMAASSLSMVAGFLSLLPGGMGVRELVLDQLLKPEFGPVIAPLAAITLRLVWLVTELVASAILYGIWGRTYSPQRSRI